MGQPSYSKLRLGSLSIFWFGVWRLLASRMFDKWCIKSKPAQAIFWFYNEWLYFTNSRTERLQLPFQFLIFNHTICSALNLYSMLPFCFLLSSLVSSLFGLAECWPFVCSSWLLTDIAAMSLTKLFKLLFFISVTTELL